MTVLWLTMAVCIALVIWCLWLMTQVFTAVRKVRDEILHVAERLDALDKDLRG